MMHESVVCYSHGHMCSLSSFVGVVPAAAGRSKGGEHPTWHPNIDRCTTRCGEQAVIALRTFPSFADRCSGVSVRDL